MAKEINKIEYNGKTFYQTDIKNGNMYLAASLLSEQLEVNTFEFDLVSDDTSLTVFRRNDKLTYWYKGRQFATFYLQNVEQIGPRMYNFSANSAIGLLMEGRHYGGIYTGQTVAEVLPGIMGTVPYYIKSNLKDIKLYGWLPVAAPRDNLCQVLFAIGATVKTDLDGYLRIESFWDSVSSLTGRDRIYTGARVNHASAVTSVAVTEHQYVEGTEETNLFEGTAAEGDIVTFGEPMHSLSAAGFTILESGANYARLSAGSGTLRGKKYIHNTRQIVRAAAPAETPNVKEVKEATLISLVNSQATAERLANYYKWLETVDAAVVYKGEKPGDVVQLYHPYDRTNVTACLQSADITLSNVLKAQEKALVGYIPPMTEQIVTYEYRVVLTGSGTWTPPEGVVSARAVLIAGGSGGQGGYDGKAGASTEASKASKPGQGYSSTYHPGGEGGDGGEKGVGGSGGKVLVSDVAIPEGVSSVQYSCGPGGAGGAVNGGAGQPGADTTLSVGGIVYSSADGSASAIGYTDLQTGEIYAVQGVSGKNGGKGGAGGTYNTIPFPEPSNENNGENGEGVGQYAGGRGSAAAFETYQNSSGRDSRGLANCGAGGGGAAEGSVGGAAGEGWGSIRGGNGADAVSPGAASGYGTGGAGGHGGGGGGGGGGTFAIISSEEDYFSSVTAPGVSGGAAGHGSPGGAGSPGCIILYYGVPHAVSSGWLKTRDGKFFNGRLSRRFIV